MEVKGAFMYIYLFLKTCILILFYKQLQSAMGVWYIMCVCVDVCVNTYVCVLFQCSDL